MKKLINSIKQWKNGRAGYKEYKKLYKSLPEEYRLVFREIEKYIWSINYDGNSMIVLLDILEKFSKASIDGRNVISVTGEDVSLFCDNLCKNLNVKTWIDKCRENLNKIIQQKIKQ
ncbi:hypothetical protein R84B8_02307 [Treponema sp. R8-4-B8]